MFSFQNPEYFMEEEIIRHEEARAVLLSKNGEHQVTHDNASRQELDFVY